MLFALEKLIHNEALLIPKLSDHPHSLTTHLLTFDKHLSRCCVGAAGVCSQTGIATCVVLKGFCYDQGVEVPALRADLNIGSVVQFPPLTEPSAGHMEVKGQERKKGNGDV